MLTAVQVARYRTLRRKTTAQLAHFYASQSRAELREITTDLAEVVTPVGTVPTGVTITVRWEPEAAPDTSWVGRFTDEWEPGAVVAMANAPRRSRLRYFVPALTVAERRADLSRLGFSRGMAQEQAEQSVRQDMEYVREPDSLMVTVEAIKSGAVVASETIGDVLVGDGDLMEVLADAAMDLIPTLVAVVQVSAMSTDSECDHDRYVCSECAAVCRVCQADLGDEGTLADHVATAHTIGESDCPHCGRPYGH